MMVHTPTLYRSGLARVVAYSPDSLSSQSSKRAVSPHAAMEAAARALLPSSTPQALVCLHGCVFACCDV